MVSKSCLNKLVMVKQLFIATFTTFYCNSPNEMSSELFKKDLILYLTKESI